MDKKLHSPFPNLAKLILAIGFTGLFIGHLQPHFLPRFSRQGHFDGAEEKALYKIIRKDFSIIDQLFITYLMATDVIDREFGRKYGYVSYKSPGPKYDQYIQERFYPESYCQLGNKVGDWEISIHAYSYFGLLYKNYLFTCSKVDVSTYDGFGRSKGYQWIYLLGALILFGPPVILTIKESET